MMMFPLRIMLKVMLKTFLSNNPKNNFGNFVSDYDDVEVHSVNKNNKKTKYA